MSDGIQLAAAYFQLIPSMKGAETDITKELIPAAEKAGDQAGDKAGGRFGSSLKAKLGGAALVAGVVGAFKGLYEVGAVFDDVGDTIRVGTGATGKDLEGLVDVAKSVGRKVPVEFENIGSTVADVNTRMGLSGDTLELVASQYLNASRILGEDVDIMKTGAAFNAFKIEGDAVAGAMDHLFQVSQATGIGMNDLASTISIQAPALQNLGFSFEEATVMIGSFDKAGLNASALMGSMSKGLVTLAKDGEKPQAAFERTVSEIEGFIKKGDEAAALDLAGKVFGTRGASQFVGAIQAGALSLDDLAKAAGQTDDTINDVASETDDFAEKWQLVKNNALLALEPLGSAVFDSLANVFSDLMPYIESFGTWLADNQWALAVFASVIGVALVIAFATWTKSIWAANAALLTSPITWIVLGIVALIAAIVLIATKTTWFQDIWDAVWGFITAAIGTAIDVVKGYLAALVEFWTAVWNGVKAVAEAVWNAIVTGITTYINTVKTVITTVLTTVKNLWESIWNGIKTVSQTVWNAIVKGITTYINTVKTVITTVLNAVKSLWTGTWNTLKSTATSAWNGITSFFSGAVSKFKSIFSSLAGVVGAPFKGAFNGIAKAWNNTVGKISFTAPDWIPGLGGKGWSVPNIPMLAKGGIVTEPTLALIGEAGPEAVFPLDKIDQYLAGDAPATGGGIEINVGTLAVREEADIRRIAEELERLINRDRRAV